MMIQILNSKVVGIRGADLHDANELFVSAIEMMKVRMDVSALRGFFPGLCVF